MYFSNQLANRTHYRFSHLFDGRACDVTTQLWKAEISFFDMRPPECLNVEVPRGVVVVLSLSGWGSTKVEQFCNDGGSSISTQTFLIHLIN